MKTSIKQTVALIFAALILFQGCTAYKSANVSLEEAVKRRTDVKITTNNNHIYTFSRVKFEEGEYYGYRNVNLKNNGKYKVHLVEENLDKIQLKDGKKSNTMTAISYGVLGAAVLGLLIGVGVKSFQKNCCF